MVVRVTCSPPDRLSVGLMSNQSSLTLAASITCFHLAASDLMRAPSSSGVPRAGTAPNSASFANNSWAIAIRGDLAKTQSLATLEDFAAYLGGGGRIKLATSAEFVESPGALPAFEKAYGFTLGRNQLLTLVGGDTSATIRAAAEGISGVNTAMAYGTDGALAALDMVVLADDKGAQTVYRPAPVIRSGVLAQHPEIAALLDPAFRSLTLQRLQALNAKIAVDGEDAQVVARAYLRANGFLK